LTDVIITHPQLLTPTIPDPDASTEDAEPIANPRIRPITKILLKAFNSDNKRITLIACTAASKLLLLGILPPLPTAEVLKAFVLTYFDPETAANPALRQALSYFLPVFCHSKLRNAKGMAEIAVPVISKLLVMREETVEEEEMDEMVGWPVITAHLAEWTDGRKVVGATELGLDGKESSTAGAEEPHIGLAIEVLERALTNTCSKDERKPLLSLLGKVYIAPSSSANRRGEEEGVVDEETLRTLHGLVSEAVEGKIGTDATQRNALIKLETTLTKRLGEVQELSQELSQELPTQIQGSEAIGDRSAETTIAPEAEGETIDAETTEVDNTQAGAQEPSTNQEEEEEEEDTMLAGMQGESTRMPLEASSSSSSDNEEEDVDGESIGDGHSTLTVGRDDRKRLKLNMVTEDDIMESLLQSELEGSS
jgi:condensin complex subunit 3